MKQTVLPAGTASALSTGIAGFTDQKLATERLGDPNVQGTDQQASVQQLINSGAVYQYKLARWQPISVLNPEVLTSQLTEWNVGTMRRFSLTMDAVENRDLIVKGATGKLKMALARRNYEIVKVEGADPDEADAHSDALKYFYNNLTATSAVDRNIRGGFSRLVQLIMDAALKRYAPFEIIWEPRGEMLTATFVHVPLWFFENRTGILRFAGNFSWDGVPLREGKWMVACGEGIMESIVVAWMYKTLALRDWLIYSERNGMPAPIAKTPHAKGTPAWNALSDALQNIGVDSTVIIGLQDEIEKLDFGAAGALPYPILVQYCDRAICSIARGADLGTLSSGQETEGTGASLQGDESDLIEQHYGQMVSETLNHYVDPFILKWHFGEDVVPCAYTRLDIPKKKDINAELMVDDKLVTWGVELGVENALERYGRVEAGPGDRILQNPFAMQPGEGQEFDGEFGANSRLTEEQRVKLARLFVKQASNRLARRASERCRPAITRLLAANQQKRPEDFLASLRGLRAELPALMAEADPKTRKELAFSLALNR